MPCRGPPVRVRRCTECTAKVPKQSFVVRRTTAVELSTDRLHRPLAVFDPTRTNWSIAAQRPTDQSHAPAAAAGDRGRRSRMLRTSPRDQAEWLVVYLQRSTYQTKRAAKPCVGWDVKPYSRHFTSVDVVILFYFSAVEEGVCLASRLPGGLLSSVLRFQSVKAYRRTLLRAMLCARRNHHNAHQDSTDARHSSMYRRFSLVLIPPCSRIYK